MIQILQIRVTDEPTDEPTDGRMEGRADGQTDRPTDRRTDRPTGGGTYQLSYGEATMPLTKSYYHERTITKTMKSKKITKSTKNMQKIHLHGPQSVCVCICFTQFRVFVELLLSFISIFFSFFYSCNQTFVKTQVQNSAGLFE